MAPLTLPKNAGQRHDTHILAVGGGGAGAGKSGEHGRETIAQQGIVKARNLQQIASDDVAGDEQMSDVLGDHDQCRRHDDEDGGPVKNWHHDVRKGEDSGTMQGRKIHCARHKDVDDHRHEVAGDHSDEDRYGGEESSEDQRAEDNHEQSKERDQRRGPADGGTLVECHAGCNWREFQTDQSHDGAHCRRGQDYIKPFASGESDNERDDGEDETGGDKASERVLESNSRRFGEGNTRDCGSDKSEARSQVCRSLASAYECVYEGSNAVHQQHKSRIDNRGSCGLIKEDWDEDGRAEHRKQMLQAERNAFEQRHLLIDLDSLTHGCGTTGGLRLLSRNGFGIGCQGETPYRVPGFLEQVQEFKNVAIVLPQRAWLWPRSLSRQLQEVFCRA